MPNLLIESEGESWSTCESSDEAGAMGGERRKMPDPSMMAMQIETLRSDFSKVEASVNAMTEAVARLAVIEERQANNHEAQNRMFQLLDEIKRDLGQDLKDFKTKTDQEVKDLRGRLHMIEVDLPRMSAQSDNSSKWISHAITACLTGLFAYVATQLGLFP